MNIDYLDYLLIKNELEAIFENWYGAPNSKFETFEMMTLENSKLAKRKAEHDEIYKIIEGNNVGEILYFNSLLIINGGIKIGLHVEVNIEGSFKIEIYSGQENEIKKGDFHPNLKRIFSAERTTGDIQLEFSNKKHAYASIIAVLDSIHETYDERNPVNKIVDTLCLVITKHRP